MTAVWRWTSWVVLLATSLVAGSHAVYYLYQWEWVRAQLAATAFVATLVVLGTRLVLVRIGRSEAEVLRRLDALARAVPAAGPAQPRAPADPPDDLAPDLPWLATALSPPRQGVLGAPALLLLLGGAAAASPAGPVEPQVGVFIPVLLGAGIAVSLVAGLVEHLSAAVHRRATSGLVGSPAAPTRPGPTADGRTGAASRRRRPVAVGSGLLVAAAVAVAGIWSTAHYRPVELGEGTTRITVQVRTQARPLPAEETVELVGRFCTRHAIAGVQVVQVDPVSGTTADLVVRPLLDQEGRQRLRGCLEDATLDRHVLTVLDVGLEPEGSS